MSRRTILTISSLVATATMAAAPALAADTPAPAADTQAASSVLAAAASSTAQVSSSSAASASASSAVPSSEVAASSTVVANDSSVPTSVAGNGSSTTAGAAGSSTSVAGTASSTAGSSTSVAAGASSTTSIAGTGASTTTTTAAKPGTNSTTTVSKVASAGAANTTTTAVDPAAAVNKSLFEAPVGGWPVRPIVFPTLGAVSYYDGWGDYRGDIATHFHIGVDILGSKLQPLVAVTNGQISHIVQNHVTAGWGLVITDDEGYDYRYYHMNNDTPGTDDATNPTQWRFAPGITEGSRVVAGQLIGYMGDSGDAEATTHTHFEIHRPDGTPINPFPSVRAAEKGTRCNPVKGLGDMPNFVPPTDADAQIVTTDAYSGIGSFTLSANGTVFRVGSARQIGDPRFIQADGPCNEPGK
jgi:murein DD-endopeptidase MepM/ murein hydrolase activator NlpD